MKFCNTCKQERPISDFSKRSSTKDGLQSNCKHCRKLIDAESYLKYAHRRNSIKDRRDANNAYNLKLMRRYKALCGCLVCREREPVALDLHHLDPSQKDHNPSKVVCYSTETMKKEIRKCVVLCANCHRKVHAGVLNLPL